MSLSPEALKNLEKLAYLESNEEQTAALTREINEIIHFVEKLLEAKTDGIAPLFHPNANPIQRLAEDEVSEASCLQELAEIAPLFDDEKKLFLVPQVIDAGR